MSITLPMFAEALHAATKNIRRSGVSAYGAQGFLFCFKARQRYQKGLHSVKVNRIDGTVPIHHHPAAVCIFGVEEGHGPIGRGGPHRCKRCIKAIGRRVGIRDLCGDIACQEPRGCSAPCCRPDRQRVHRPAATRSGRWWNRPHFPEESLCCCCPAGSETAFRAGCRCPS